MGEGRGGSQRGNPVRSNGRDRSAPGVTGAEFAGIGVQFAFTILVFVFLGVWLDRRLGTSPWLLLVFVFVGAAGGFYSMYRRITAAQRREAKARAERKAAGGSEGEP
jgi:F0F1-type ATP synthase assembly protein I